MLTLMYILFFKGALHRIMPRGESNRRMRRMPKKRNVLFFAVRKCAKMYRLPGPFLTFLAVAGVWQWREMAVRRSYLFYGTVSVHNHLFTSLPCLATARARQKFARRRKIIYKLPRLQWHRLQWRYSKNDWLRWHPAYSSDTFGRSQGCHSKRGSLYIVWALCWFE